MKKEIVRYIEIMGGIVLNDIVMNNSIDAEDGLKYLNKMFDKSLGTIIENTVKTTTHYQIKRIMSKTDEDHLLWRNLKELMEKTR